MESIKRIGGPEYQLDLKELEWQLRAACLHADPNLFFPEQGGRTTKAKQICGSCVVRDECRQYAIENDEQYGVWGGLSKSEREQLPRHVAS
jgi:WhiB family redox-sensing transcriptional regulator